jgi:hypothetical protein
MFLIKLIWHAPRFGALGLGQSMCKREAEALLGIMQQKVTESCVLMHLLPARITH